MAVVLDQVGVFAQLQQLVHRLAWRAARGPSPGRCRSTGTLRTSAAMSVCATYFTYQSTALTRFTGSEMLMFARRLIGVPSGTGIGVVLLSTIVERVRRAVAPG